MKTIELIFTVYDIFFFKSIEGSELWLWESNQQRTGLIGLPGWIILFIIN